MKNPEEKTEQLLKNRMSSVYPPRALFEQTLKRVTNMPIHRSTVEKAGVPSPYQLINNFIMKKIALIGIPVLALALVAMVAIKKPGMDTKDASIDSIVASFNADADADATLASSESQDDADLTTQLQDYNNIKTTDYENNL